jgi:hypothetical protein
MPRFFSVSLVLFLVIFGIGAILPAHIYAAGFVPCGGCEVALDAGTGECPAGQEQQACTLCHVFEMGNRFFIFLFVPSVYNGGFAFVPLLAGLFFVIGGFLLLVGNLGNPQLLSRGRTILFTTIVGLLIIYGAWAGINTLLNFLNVNTFLGTDFWWSIECGG